MVKIEQTKCIGCGSCVNDCVVGNIALADGIANCNGTCILCGHCVAICPENAVSIPEYDMADVETIVTDYPGFTPENLLSMIKSRRSIRQYVGKLVERKKLEQIVQAGRYTATGSNSQGCRFIIVQDNLSALKDVVWIGIAQAQGQAAPIPAELLERLQGFERLRKKGTDYLFRDAPAVIYIAAASSVDAALAAQNMEHMAIAQGLGVLYDGFLVGAANLLEPVQEWLDTGDKPVQVCMLVGYPRVTYRRTVPRKPADIRWK